MKFLSVLLVLFSLSSWAKGINLENYVKMQEALANDDFKSALTLHKLICAKGAESYKDCNKAFEDFEELRESFKTLSSVVIANRKKEDMSGLIVAECPMAKAKWIQKEGKISNPYYGKSMLECGQKL
jgi:hypothetical protein